MKKALSILLSVTLVLLLSFDTFASSDNYSLARYQVDYNAISSKVKVSNKETVEKELLKRIEQMDELKKDKEKMIKAKQAVSNFVNSPEFNKSNTKNSLESALSAIESEQRAVSLSSSKGTLLYYEWMLEPYVAAVNDFSYYGPWITVNAFKLNIPVSVKTTMTSTCSVTLGLKGTITLSELLKFGFEGSAESKLTHSASYEVGFTVPAWEKVSKCAKIRTLETTYVGKKRNFYLVGLTKIETEDVWVAAVNTSLLEKSVDFWQARNLTQNPYATEPNPPYH